jgi:hypothetical protein
MFLVGKAFWSAVKRAPLSFSGRPTPPTAILKLTGTFSAYGCRVDELRWWRFLVSPVYLLPPLIEVIVIMMQAEKGVVEPGEPRAC